MSRIDQSAVRNRLLASMPAEAFAALADHLRPVELPFGQTLYLPDQPLDRVLFPERGMVSQIATLADGEVQEVGVVGREGLIGVAVVLGGDRATVEGVVQGQGEALRAGAEALQDAMDRSAPLRAHLLRYAQAFLVQVTQTAACTGHHAVEARLARWLLMVHDRVEADEFALTQEFMANMLGVRRPSVSVAAAVLQREGLIRYARGHVTMLDRPRLEAASCECYAAVRRQLDRLLGDPAAGR